MTDREWEDHIRGSAGVCVICPVCGGGSSAFCECAKEKWIKSMNDSVAKELTSKEWYCETCGKKSTENHLQWTPKNSTKTITMCQACFSKLPNF